mmetsp:Transcript_16047/g.47658  ORF Transcript_16047/g.47658 Transcript_16047/m.47658 type:complete len:202 (-) Transcript_16047:194-799(-)
MTPGKAAQRRAHARAAAADGQAAAWWWAGHGVVGVLRRWRGRDESQGRCCFAQVQGCRGGGGDGGCGSGGSAACAAAGAAGAAGAGGTDAGGGANAVLVLECAGDRASCELPVLQLVLLLLPHPLRRRLTAPDHCCSATVEPRCALRGFPASGCGSARVATGAKPQSASCARPAAKEMPRRLGRCGRRVRCARRGAEQRSL